MDRANKWTNSTEDRAQKQAHDHKEPCYLTVTARGQIMHYLHRATSLPDRKKHRKWTPTSHSLEGKANSRSIKYKCK